MRKVADISYLVYPGIKNWQIRQALLNVVLNDYWAENNAYPENIMEDEGAKFAANCFASPWYETDEYDRDADHLLEDMGITKVRLHKSTGLCSYTQGE